jgi:hypothetical protein
LFMLDKESFLKNKAVDKKALEDIKEILCW